MSCPVPCASISPAVSQLSLPNLQKINPVERIVKGEGSEWALGWIQLGPPQGTSSLHRGQHWQPGSGNASTGTVPKTSWSCPKSVWEACILDSKKMTFRTTLSISSLCSSQFFSSSLWVKCRACQSQPHATGYSGTLTCTYTNFSGVFLEIWLLMASLHNETGVCVWCCRMCSNLLFKYI